MIGRFHGAFHVIDTMPENLVSYGIRTATIGRQLSLALDIVNRFSG